MQTIHADSAEANGSDLKLLTELVEMERRGKRKVNILQKGFEPGFGSAQVLAVAGRISGSTATRRSVGSATAHFLLSDDDAFKL